MTEQRQELLSEIRRLSRESMRVSHMRESIRTRIADLEERAAALTLAEALKATGRERAIVYADQIIGRVQAAPAI